jgi:hypothetical protein
MEQEIMELILLQIWDNANYSAGKGLGVHDAGSYTVLFKLMTMMILLHCSSNNKYQNDSNQVML